MSLEASLTTGLKEWAVVCRALESGRQILLLRKGGILESSTGFELEHGQFLLFPTYLHQNRDMLKPDAQAQLETHAAEPARIAISAAAEVTDILRLQYRKQMDALDSEHIWTSPLIDMRFNYKPQNPLYLLLVRGYRLQSPITIDNTPAYAGCKSWVPLDQPVSVENAEPVLDETTYHAWRTRIIERLKH